MVRNKTKTLKQAKIDMDARVQELRDVVVCGNVASQRLPFVREQLDATQKFNNTARFYESPKYEPGEKRPEDLEAEIADLEKAVKDADVARIGLKRAAQFYRAYHFVVYVPKIQELKKRLDAAELWVEQWKDRMNLIDSDADKDIDEREQEKAVLQCEYEIAVNCVKKLQSQIDEMRNVKYM